ncbi:Hpt domain-containing protein [Frigidibacter sp. MR17.14]|uniref:Hpt domain-containing protein n=1 Tax=Frigidibacter sp. MR17.14 TaxID=3126509 RepID=UPI003012F3F7
MIDWDRVEELRSELGAEGFREVTELFLEEVEGLLDRCPNRPERREDDFHFLKGSAWNIGFAALADICQEGERQAARGAPMAVDLGDVRRIWAESRAAFLTGLGPDWITAAA